MHNLLSRIVASDIKFSLELAPTLWPLRADLDQIETCIWKLVANALEAMPESGSLTIITSNQNLDADYAMLNPSVTPGNYAMIAVSETGGGMTPSVMAKIFEPFPMTEGKNTSLGLSVVLNFLKQSGGHVSVRNEPGIGTTVRLYLPCTSMDEEFSETCGVRIGDRGAGQTILVVEDNPYMRRAVMRQIRQLGYHALECDTAVAALDILQHEQVDLLLTDIVMPGGLDGIELTRLAKSHWPRLKIVLTSGFPMSREDELSGLLGSLQLLSKPYHKDQLASVLATSFRPT
jgi:CheY-like chemotaxis protein